MLLVTKVSIRDTRNIGGRQAVIEHMLAHQARLRSIKSTRSQAKGQVDCRPPATHQLYAARSDG